MVLPADPGAIKPRRPLSAVLTACAALTKRHAAHGRSISPAESMELAVCMTQWAAEAEGLEKTIEAIDRATAQLRAIERDR